MATARPSCGLKLTPRDAADPGVVDDDLEAELEGAPNDDGAEPGETSTSRAVRPSWWAASSVVPEPPKR